MGGSSSAANARYEFTGLYAEPLRTRRAALDWADSCAASLEPAHAQRYFFLAAGLDLAAFLAGLALFTGAFFAAGLVFSA
jgi:hypothetical protein